MSFSEIEGLMRNAQKVGSKVGEPCCSGIQSRKFKPHIFSKCTNVEQDRSPQPGLPALLLTGITKSLWPLLPYGMPLISTAPSLGAPSFPIFSERAKPPLLSVHTRPHEGQGQRQTDRVWGEAALLGGHVLLTVAAMAQRTPKLS